MRFCLGLALVVCAGMACAQTPADPASVKAQANLENLRALVAAGAAPRALLDRAESDIADASDAALLRRTLYGPDLTEEQIGGMLEAAARRRERREAAVDRMRTLVAEGVASQRSLTSYMEDLDRARKEYELAESRARLCRELTAAVRAEQETETQLARNPAAEKAAAEHYEGNGVFTPSDFERIEIAFAGRFSRPLPVSAMGETAVHRALGFDHRNRVDVAINPDEPEGIWLREYLEARHIPYFAFRHAVPGKATGAHIHIGPSSTRLAHSGAGAVSGS